MLLLRSGQEDDRVKVIRHDNKRIEGHTWTDLGHADPEIMNELANGTQLDPILDNLPEEWRSIMDAKGD